MDYQRVHELKGLALRKAVAQALGIVCEEHDIPYFAGEPLGKRYFLCQGKAQLTNFNLGRKSPEDAWERDCPAFESSVADAFPIAEKYHYAVIPVGDRWFAYPAKFLLGLDEPLSDYIDPDFCGDSPAEAICRCFLLKEAPQ